MLILNRREGDILEFTVPEAGNAVLRVAVTEIAQGQVKLGIECPRHWNIRRLEQDGIRLPPSKKGK